MTRPWPFAAAAWVNKPEPVKAGSPSAACQLAASAETTTTGCSAALAVTPPTASQPIGPCVTLVSRCVPGRPNTAGLAPVARLHALPPLAEVHAAGKPLALPTATCMPPAAATPSTASCGSMAPGIFATSIWTGAVLPASRAMAGRRVAAAADVPVTTAPRCVMATPDTVSDATAPWSPGRPARP